MAQENLRSFTINGVLAGLLLTCLLAFAIGFMYHNNPSGLGDDADYIFNETYSSSTNTLIESPQDADTLLNITANTNPEISDLGSRDIVATSYSATGTGKSSWQQMKYLISWVFTGDSGKVLLGVLGGLIGLLSYFFIMRHIRQGD